MRSHKRRHNGIFMKMDVLTKLIEVLSRGSNPLKEGELLLLAHEVNEKKTGFFLFVLSNSRDP